MPEKKNKNWQVLLIVLIVEFLYVVLSFTNADYLKISAGNFNYPVKYYSFKELVDFSVTLPNTIADSLISKYLHDETNDKRLIAKRRRLFAGEPYKKNIYLVNPSGIDGSYALDNFFAALVNQRDSCIVRIAHYGDSQLEGDRVTNILRKKFQMRFGGIGPGFIPLKDIAEPQGYIRKSGGNWCRFTVFDNKLSSGLYGMGGMVFKFNNCRYTYKASGNKGDSLNPSGDSSKQKVWLTANNASVFIHILPPASYSKISILYGNSTLPCGIKLIDKNNNTIASDTLSPSANFKIHKLKINSPVNPLRLDFTSSVSPDFYGLLMDGYNGVQVDNFAIRGHGGGGLMSINQEFLITQIRTLNTRLIIFQYGANVVPYVHDSTGFVQLEHIYYRLFNKFRNAAPDASILVIGAGDMARKTGEGYASYPQIASIVNAQRKAALKAGCAFWDLYATMGGSGSIISWASKRLAAPDGHFSYRGQEIIGNELFKAIITEYNLYLNRQRKIL